MIKKKIIWSAIFACVLTFSSCQKEDLTVNEPVITSQAVQSGSLKAVTLVDPLATPTGWQLVSSGNNVRCFKKTGTAYYVIALNLKNGATISPLYITPSPASASTSTPNPSFTTKNINYWWNTNTSAFAVTNASFFKADAQSQLTTTTLPFGLRKNGILMSAGYSFTTEYNQRWICFNGTYATIGDGPGPQSTTTNIYTLSNAFYSGIGSNVMGGLHPLNANKDKSLSIGRNMVGIKDADADGKKEMVFIFVTTSATQQGAYDVLRNEFACDQTIMFDGSGSAQMVCNGTEYVKSTDATITRPRRVFPIALQIKASS